MPKSFMCPSKALTNKKPRQDGSKNVILRPIKKEHLLLCICYRCLLNAEQDRQRTYNVPLRRVLATIVAAEKQWLLQNLCVLVALGIQHAMCVRYIVIYNIFPRYLLNGTIFENKLRNFKFVFRVFLQLLSEMFLILRKNERDMIENVYWFSCKVPFILIRF